MTDQAQPHLVSVILPVYNQADHIGGVVEQYLAAMGKLPTPFEVLLVVNGATDHSLDVCRELADKHSCVRVISVGKAGWGRAVRTGVREARGDLICYTNSARTTSGDLVLNLLYGIVFPEVVIHAHRKWRESWVRRVGSLLYNLECRALFDLSNWDVNGTPKVFPRDFARLLELSRDDDLVDAEFCAICRQENYPMVEVPLSSVTRHGGRSTTRVGSALRLYLGAIQLWRSRRT